MNIENLFETYKELSLGNNPICRKCIESNSTFLSKPISAWKVGHDYWNQQNRIMFVGKVHRGLDLGPMVDDLFQDSTNIGDELLEVNSWAYWSYTREIIKNVFGDFKSGKEKIVFTNLIKCNNSHSVDQTTQFTKKSCLSELGVFWKEVTVLKPNMVIFYTGWDYDEYIGNYHYSASFKDITNRHNKIKIGSKFMPWWHRVFYDNNGNVLAEFLRIGHPERLKKAEYINLVSSWIKNQLPTKPKLH